MEKKCQDLWSDLCWFRLNVEQLVLITGRSLWRLRCCDGLKYSVVSRTLHTTHFWPAVLHRSPPRPLHLLGGRWCDLRFPRRSVCERWAAPYSSSAPSERCTPEKKWTRTQAQGKSHPRRHKATRYFSNLGDVWYKYRIINMLLNALQMFLFVIYLFFRGAIISTKQPFYQNTFKVV